jgi:hypothetical protein
LPQGVSPPLPSPPRYLLGQSLLEYQHKASHQTLIIRPSDDPKLDHLLGIRHTILARPTGVEVIEEMFGRGLEHAARLGERYGHAFVPQPPNTPSL